MARFQESVMGWVPEGATHAVVEERLHRGSPVYAVVAIVPHGAAIPLNGYSDRSLAEDLAAFVNERLAA